MSAREHPARFPLGEAFRASRRKAGRTPLRVLVVEDSEDDALFILRELTNGGYEPLHERVDTPEAMEEALSRESWDVVISDYYMPRFKAPDALALLRRRGSDAPFVVVSGKVGEELAVEAMKAGAHDYIMKDNMTRLCATIQRGLEEVEVRHERARAEEALRLAEEKYRSIFENSTEGIFQTTIDGRIVTANPALARIFGYGSPEELMATISDVASQLYEDPDDRAEFARLIRQQGTVSNFETRMRRGDGAVIWISVNARALRTDGVLVGYEGTVRDITGRKEAERRLRQSEELYRAVVEQAAENIFLVDPETKRILEANAAFQRSLGYTAEELRQSTLYDIVAHDRESVDRNVRRVQAERRLFIGDREYRRKDGSLRNVEVSVSVVPYGDKEVQCVLSRDVTERRRAEEALRMSEKRFRTMIEQSPLSIQILSPDGRTLQVNRAWEELWGVTLDDITGYNLLEDQQLIDKGIMPYIRRGFAGESTLIPPVIYELDETIARLTDHEDSKRWVRGFIYPVKDEVGNVREVVLVHEDITERRRAEEALRESEERTRTVLANAPGLVLFALDREGVFTLSEGRGLEAMGLRPEEGVGRSIFDIYRDEPESLAHIRRALSGEEFTSVDDLTRLGLVFEVRWSPVRDGSGELTGVIGVATDITERKQAEEELRRSLDRLVALHEAGHVLGSTLEPEEIGTRLLGIMRRISGLTTAVISLREDNGRLGVWRSIGLENLGPETRHAPEVREALEAALENGATRVFAPVPSSADTAIGLCLPLRVRERSLGVLEVYGPETLAEKDTVAMLESLATQAASALENARLYGELAERERRLQELVGKILVAQEEERRRVAYEVHDGLAQVAAAAHQHLQAFAQYHPPTSREGREDLDRVSKLVRQTVGEARRIIADLRPTALDDLGLEAAVRLQLEALRAEGWQIAYEGDLDDERLPVHVETALFRVAQEALTNIVKHARTRRVSLALERLRGPREAVRLSVRDYGVGFSPDAPASMSGPGERVGLSGMRERVALLGGDFRVASRPGAGTLIVAEVPLRGFVAGHSGDGADGR